MQSDNQRGVHHNFIPYEQGIQGEPGPQGPQGEPGPQEIFIDTMPVVLYPALSFSSIIIGGETMYEMWVNV